MKGTLNYSIHPKKNLLISYLLRYLLLCVFLIGSNNAWASGGDKEKEFDAGEMIMHHIKDSYGWEIAEGLTIPLPLIIYSDNGLDVFMSSAIHHAKAAHPEEHGEDTHKEGAQKHKWRER